MKLEFNTTPFHRLFELGNIDLAYPHAEHERVPVCESWSLYYVISILVLPQGVRRACAKQRARCRQLSIHTENLELSAATSAPAPMNTSESHRRLSEHWLTIVSNDVPLRWRRPSHRNGSLARHLPRRAPQVPRYHTLVLHRHAVNGCHYRPYQKRRRPATA